jgi:hypothetical protein
MFAPRGGAIPLTRAAKVWGLCTKMFNFSGVTARSILFVFCVSTGLAMSSLQGVSILEIVQTALLASTLFLSFMIWEAMLEKRQRAVARRRQKGQ